MAEGFVGAKSLARKFVTLYQLCKDLLSKQLHYDWGLRAIKSVLVVAGTFKRAEQDIPEDSLLFRALRDFNYPKIAQVDLSIFDGLLSDLFPGINIERKANIAFEQKIRDVTAEQKLTDDPNFVLKVAQLGELLEIRHCVFLMGPPGSGKTTTWKTLGKANTADNNKTTALDIDPKVVSTRDLYGYTNMTTKEWKNGLLSHYMQYFSEELTDGKPKWIVLDGDLDANWIESMNSVMDDNKLLTLANNGRIVVRDYMRLLFEIKDLRFATPATVSRAGILYISDDKGYQRACYFNSWVKARKFEPALAEFLHELNLKYVEATISYVYKKCKFVMPVSFFGMNMSLCRLLQHLIDKYNAADLLYIKEEKNKVLNKVKVEHIFGMCVVWAFGGALTIKDNKDFRKEFSDWWKGMFTKPVKFPAKGTIFDYYVKIEENKQSFEEWKSLLEPINFDGEIPMQNITVPIPETLSIKELTKYLIFEKHPTLLIGNAGSGKTQLIKGLLKEIRKSHPENYYFTTVNFNFYTNSDYLQAMLEADLVKQGTYYGPKKGAQIKLIYFIDDLNMPQLDPYNTQTSIALLRQHIDHSHWYDITKAVPILKEIHNTQVIAAMNPTSGSFYVNPRYQRHFWVSAVSFPESSSLTLIYETFLKGHFAKFKTSIQEITNPLIKAAITLHEKVVGSFKKTAVNFHYEFNIRHLSNIFAGILQSTPSIYSDPDKMVRLWFHESERIYCDRLIEPIHIKTYQEISIDTVKKAFPRNSVTRHYQGDNPEPLVFCTFAAGFPGEATYDVCAFKDCSKYVTDALSAYNDDNVQMNLVLFDDAIKHVTKITRIIKNPSGHALLVGVGGSGKQSLSRLSAFMGELTPFSITVSQSYGMNDLKNDLIGLYDKCGAKDLGYLFTITDSHITKEEFLVYINDLLSSGEIADLYIEDDKMNIINAMRQKAKAENRGENNDDIWSFYIDMVKKNLHCALCFSPIGDAFRSRARRFPGIVNSSVIDWFQNWPEQALTDVSKQFLLETELGEDAIRDAVIKFMPFSFNVVNESAKSIFEKERRYIYNTPKSFLELIKLFTNMLNAKRTKLEDDKTNYEMGLEKLIKTEEDVTKLEEYLKVTQVQVDAARKEADEVAEKVGIEKAKVEEENAKAKVKKDKAMIIKADVEKQQIYCQSEVDKLEPIVNNALANVKNLKPDEVKEARSFGTPPSGVAEVFNCIQYMFANVQGYTENIELNKATKLPKNLSWNDVKKEILNKPDVLISQLLSFNKEIAANNVPAVNFKKVKEYFEDKDFNSVNMLNKSKAAAAVLTFVEYMLTYYTAMTDMIPKQIMLKEAQEKLRVAMEELEIVEALVEKLNIELAEKQKNLDEANAKKNAAQAMADQLNNKLNLAQRLVSALASEKIRWGDSIQTLNHKLKLLVGDVLMASGFISYAGPFSKVFRTNIINVKFKKF